MSGHFHKIIGKTITGVYCRENERAPKGQVFITFDDGTYFEMYTMSDEIKGIKGLNPGDLDHVVGLNHPEGKEIHRYPESQEVMMWVPPLISYPNIQVALGVPTEEKVRSNDDYWQLLFKHIKNLINHLSENEAADLIEKYLLEGSNIIKNYKRDNWAENILEQKEFEVLDDLYDLDFDSIPDSELHGCMRIRSGRVTLENLLKVIQVKFELSDDDKYLINKIDDLAALVLKNNSLSPGYIVSIGRLLYVLRRFPLSTQGACIDISFRLKDIPGLFLDCRVTDERFALSLGGTESGDTTYYIDWFVDLNSSREEEGDAAYLEDNPFFFRGADVEVSIDDESDFIVV